MKIRKLLAGIMALAIIFAVPVNFPSLKEFSITAHAVDDGTKIVAENLSCTVLSTDEDGTVNLQVNSFSDEVGDAETLEFPETVDGIPVRYISIQGEEFQGSSLTEVILPDTIESIDSAFSWSGVFKNCFSLKKVHLPENEKFHCIDYETFYGCSSLEEINIPDSVNRIRDNAFSNTALLTAQKDENIKYIGNWAISCERELPLEFEEGTVGIADGFLQGGAFDMFGIVSNTSKMVFPSSLRYIGSTSFKWVEDMNTVVIPDGIEIIYSNAFEDNSGLQEVIFSGTVGSIRSKAFYGCENLTSVQFNGKMLKNFGESAFSGCSSLTEITLPEGITEISEGLFADCAKLADIDLPESLTSIPNAKSSFYGTALYADGLSDLRYADDWIIKVNSGFNGDSITIKDGVVGIAGGAFSEQQTLTSVIFPDTLKYIDNNAFYYCNVLTSVTIPESVISIGDSAFSSCNALASVTIKNPNCEIGDSNDTLSSPHHYGYNFDCVIYGYENSTAQAYAEKYGYKFETLDGEPPKMETLKQGDADSNGDINILDVILVNRAILGKSSLTAEQVKAVDFNGNGYPEPEEALMIMKYIVGIITDFS